MSRGAAARWLAALLPVVLALGGSPATDALPVLASSKRLQICGEPALRPDAEKLLASLAEAQVRLDREFPTIGAQLALTVVLHAEPDGRASESTATLQSSHTEDASIGQLDLLAPSKMPASARTNMGLPKDDAYYAKLLIHEYATLYLERFSRSKAAGWRWNTAPNWFIQGYEEYLGFALADQDRVAAARRRYLDIVRADRGRVDFIFGVSVEDPYVDGMVLLWFLHDEFSASGVARVVTSPQRSFGRAVAIELGVTLSDLEARWSAWLDRQAAEAPK